MKKFFYAFIRFSLSNYNHLYFDKFRVVGKENIPNDGAILFSPNHQNALLDPLLVGTTAGKSIHSLTRSDVFGGPLQWVLDAMQTIPVYRIRDGYSQLKNNTAVFEHCYSLLANKENVMIFSEGKHHDQYYLLRLSKGSARLAMEAQKRAPKHPIYLQPVGINYGSHLHPRHDCVVVYGIPIKVNDFISIYTTHPAKGINALRDALQREMEACLWLPKNDSNYTKKKAYLNRKNTHQRFELLKSELEKDQPNLAKARPTTLFDRMMVVLFSLPNLPVHLALSALRKQFDDHVFHGSINYLGGLVFFLIWWTIGITGFTLGASPLWGLSFFLFSLFSLFLRQFFVVKSL